MGGVTPKKVSRGSRIDGIEVRFDKPCGRSHIADNKKCSPDKLRQLTADLKAGDAGAKKRVQEGKRSAERKRKLKREVEAALKARKEPKQQEKAPAKRAKQAPRLPDGVDVNESKLTPGHVIYMFEVDGKDVSMGISPAIIRGISDVDVVFSVDYSLDKGSLSGNGAIRAAIKLRDTMLYDASKRPNGFVYRCTAHTEDGYGNKRVKAYKRMGFSEPEVPGYPQYAVVRNGKLEPYEPKGLFN